jgi:hypothetical protein
MQLGGRVWKSGKHWLVDVPALGAMTQGRIRADAVRMLEASSRRWPMTRASRSRSVRGGRNGVFAIGASDVGTLARLVVRRQREKLESPAAGVPKRAGA